MILIKCHLLSETSGINNRIKLLNSRCGCKVPHQINFHQPRETRKKIIRREQISEWKKLQSCHKKGH